MGAHTQRRGHLKIDGVHESMIEPATTANHSTITPTNPVGKPWHSGALPNKLLVQGHRPPDDGVQGHRPPDDGRRREVVSAGDAAAGQDDGFRECATTVPSLPRLRWANLGTQGLSQTNS